jgi:tetratricopeptide (TPR) repeat protein
VYFYSTVRIHQRDTQTLSKDPNRFCSHLYFVSLCLFVLYLLTQPAFAADKWLGIQTKNFLLVGNASESDIRRAGRTLEEFRSAVAMIFPKMEQTSSAPTTILVFKDDASLQPYKPLYKGQPSNLLAFFQPGEDVNYIAVTATPAAPNVVLHEYVHFLLRENVGGLPLWIKEGLAECYSTFELTGRNEFTIGRPPEQHIATFSTPQQFIPLKRLLTIQDGSPEYNEASKQGMFYAESWAIVHYLVFGPDAKRRSQFAKLLTSLAAGQTFEDAFGDAFQTDYGTLEDEVREYIRKRSSWPMMKVASRDTLQVDVRSVTAKTLPEAEYEFYLGDLLLHLNRLDDAEPHLTAALSKNPNLTAAQTSLAVLRVRQRRYDDALALLKKAVETDSKNYIVHFYYAYALERADEDAPAAIASSPAEKYETMRTYAKKSIDLAPRYVEAYLLLARLDLTAGEHLDEAEATLKKAVSIAPGREDLQLMLAQTYLRTSRREDARAVLSVIERTAVNPDIRRRVTTLLDQTEQTFTFTEITPGIEKELAKEKLTPAPAPAPPANRRVQETVLEALTPIGPAVEGEKLSGLLTNMDCSNGLTLRVRTDRTTTELHSSDPRKVQFLSYTTQVTDNIRCGPQNPAKPVVVTYRPTPGGSGEPLVIEFQDK